MMQWSNDVVRMRVCVSLAVTLHLTIHVQLLQQVPDKIRSTYSVRLVRQQQP